MFSNGFRWSANSPSVLLWQPTSSQPPTCVSSVVIQAQEDAINYEALNLAEVYKEHCVEMFEKWWNCKEIDLGFCLNCNFYSDKLEICISCELKQRNSALHYKPGLQETQLQFNYDGLATLPMRWQCEECEKKASGKLDAPIFRKFEAGKKERRTDSWMQSSEKQIRETTG
ncbi:Protein CBG26350 [Caenorhabditis briggsae]|uniref:Protein CBG26350 n=2 Tax=Caenorhabditis briggsae TaxID=6238 RepID=B6IGC1_CAEBR|nr:Protein CBG26350 [Caenorhabditis briggsae]ULT95055.1 hypothetical protein L3Y34_004059 [Caenorhabditis briggsae]CAR98951.1 Protein CBG26350 [Caenorhabditis briggsae]